MKTLILLSTFLLVCFNNWAQTEGYVDVVPYAATCDTEESNADRIQCSESVLKEYFLLNIDTTLCPSKDTSRSISVILDVDNRGKYTADLKSHNMRESCLLYLQELAVKMPKSIELKPAKFDGKKVKFRKYLRFSYPESTLATDTIKSQDSTGFKMVTSMPRFYDATCEVMIGGSNDKDACSKMKMLYFIYSNLKYPSLAREDGIEGMIVTQFVIDELGYVTDLTLVRDIGGGCGEASLDVVNLFNEQEHPPFVPGMQGDEAVKVKYTLPIRFKLENGGKRKKKKRRRK